MPIVQHPWMHEADALVLGQPDDSPAREVEVAASGVVLGRGMVFPIGTLLWVRGDGAAEAVAAGTFRPAGVVPHLAAGGIMDDDTTATLGAGPEGREAVIPLPAHAKRATMVAEPVTNVAEPTPAGEEPKEPARKAKRAAKKRGA